MPVEKISKQAKWPYLLVLGGILVGAIGNSQFQVIGGERLSNSFDASGNVIEKTYVADGNFNVFLSGSGGLATDFLGAIRNPLSSRDPDSGSGVVTELYLFVDENPNAAGLDVVLAATPTTSSGHTVLIDNACSSTGCWARMSAPNGWGSGHYIVVKSLKDATTSFKGRIRGTYTDVFGE